LKVCGVPDYPDRVGVKIQAETTLNDGVLRIDMGAIFD